MFHAWYSESQERTINENGRAASIYLNESGEEVKTTEVRSVESGDQPTSLQEDIKYLGLVVKWVRCAEPIIDKKRFEQARRYRLDQERNETARQMRESTYYDLDYDYDYHYHRRS